MWIDRQAWDDLRIAEAKARGQAEELVRLSFSQQTTLDWLMLRVTQLEKERAALLFKCSGVVIETPIISQRVPDAILPNSPLDAQAIFDDMGDDAAKKLGIGWNEDGTVQHK